jgi:MFS family permease
MSGAAAVGVSGSRLLRPVPMALLASLSLVLCLVADRIEVMIVLLALGGFAAYAMNARAQGDLSRIAGERRATVLGLFHVFGGTGAFVFPLVIAWLLHLHVSWRAAAVLLGGLFAAYAWGCRDWTHTEAPKGLHLDSLKRLARGNAGAALVVAVVGVGLQVAVPLWIPTILHDRFHVSPAAASGSAAVYMVALLVTRVGSALTVHRIGGRVILVAGAAAVFAGHFVLYFANGVTMMLVATVLIGAGAGPLLPVGIARVAQWSRDDRLGTAAVMALAGVAQIALPGAVIGAHALGLSLQHAAAVTVVAAAVVLVAARRA